MGGRRFRIFLEDGGEPFDCGEDEFVLHAMIHSGKGPIRHGCCGGGCGVCKMRVVRGAYRAEKRMSRAHVSPEEQERGIVLICCIKPCEDMILGRYGDTEERKGFMAINKTLRPGLVQLRVLDLEKTLYFYKNILGLNEVCRTADGRVCLKGYDEFDHHSVTLRLADAAGLDFVAFKVSSPEELERIRAATQAFGYRVDEIPANADQPGFGKRYGWTICTGHRFEVYCDVERAEQMPMIHNPDIWTQPPRGMRAQRMDHFLLYGPNIAEAERFCTEVFGMFVPEVCNTPDGGRMASWITGSNKPHDLAFVEYPQLGKLHHVGFYLQDWNDVGNAADWIALFRLKLDIGPTRHAITRGHSIYFWEPSGNRIEVYAGGYTAYPDNPQRVWDSDKLGRGLFYYSGEVIPSFLDIVT